MNSCAIWPSSLLYIRDGSTSGLNVLESHIVICNQLCETITENNNLERNLQGF